MFSIVGQISHLHIFTGPPLRRLQVDQHVVKQVLIMYCVCVSKVKPYTYTMTTFLFLDRGSISIL